MSGALPHSAPPGMRVGAQCRCVRAGNSPNDRRQALQGAQVGRYGDVHLLIRGGEVQQHAGALFADYEQRGTASCSQSMLRVGLSLPHGVCTPQGWEGHPVNPNPPPQ